MFRAQAIRHNTKPVGPIKMDKPIPTTLNPPRLVNGRTLLIAGLGERYTAETSAGIPAQWQRFSPYLGDIPGQVGRTAYGVLVIATTRATRNTCAASKYRTFPGFRRN